MSRTEGLEELEELELGRRVADYFAHPSYSRSRFPECYPLLTWERTTAAEHAELLWRLSLDELAELGRRDALVLRLRVSGWEAL